MTQLILLTQMFSQLVMESNIGKKQIKSGFEEAEIQHINSAARHICFLSPHLHFPPTPFLLNALRPGWCRATCRLGIDSTFGATCSVSWSAFLHFVFIFFAFPTNSLFCPVWDPEQHVDWGWIQLFVQYVALPGLHLYICIFCISHFFKCLNQTFPLFLPILPSPL